MEQYARNDAWGALVHMHGRAMLDVQEVTGGLRGCWGVIGRDLIRRAGPPVKIRGAPVR